MKTNISLCLGIIFFVGLFQTGFCGSFLHGVASGDFTPNAVIIWTRYTPSSGQEDLIDIHWRVSLSNDLTDLSSLVRWGVYTTSSARDYTVKVDVGHLSPNTQYYYGFSDDAVFSPVGKTRTAPSTSADIEQLNFIFVSCQAWRHGYYHAYSLASQADNIDFWIHLGDVIYEEGDYANPGTAQGVREGQLPSVEVVTLDEYRQRHAFYRLESPFQQMAARAPLIAIWDDHEMADNSYGTGADNHEPVCVDAEGRRPGDPGFTPVKCDKDEGSWSTRKLAAEQAYREWMPIRETKSSQSNPFDITRTFEWGNLATIFATDHRVQDDGHRTCVFNCGSDLSNSAFAFVASQIDDPAQIPNNPTLTQLAAQFMSVSEQTNQSAINDNQINALINAFKSSKSAGKPWQFFLSTVIFSNIPYPNFLDTAQLYPSPLKEGLIQYFDTIYANPQTYGYLFRVAYAGSVYDIPFDFQTWDAFPVQRQRLLEIFKEHTNNLVVLAGDSHSAYAHDLRLGDPNTGELVGVEFSGPSLTSFGVETVSPPYWDTFGTVGFDYLNTVWINEHTKYANVIDRGFVFTRVSKTSVISEYHYIRPDVTAVYPYGSFALANATWDGNYYCQQVATEVDSHTLSPTGAPCGATFGHGLDDLDTSISAPFYSSSSSFSVCVLILLSLIILAFAF